MLYRHSRQKTKAPGEARLGRSDEERGEKFLFGIGCNLLISMSCRAAARRFGELRQGDPVATSQLNEGTPRCGAS